MEEIKRIPKESAPPAESLDETRESLPAVSPQAERDKQAPEPPSLAKSVLSWGKTILFAFILALLIKNFVVVNATVMSGSMEETIMTDDRIMCNRLSYIFSSPSRYDIISFDFVEPDGTERVYVKRIIGLPGETLEIIEGKVYINGATEPLRDNFINDPPQGNFGPYEIPEDHYFVMGDNRNNSADSRRWEDSFLSRDAILGKAMFRYYPNITWLGNK